MAVKAEEIRQAKKFLENKKLSIKIVKPRIFAQVAKKANVNFDKLLNSMLKEINGKVNNSNKEKNTTS
jgi:hypothetical protein|tara:strand:- start:408 stop:611 length:204 start_codon:yes stop_codon:yes gene_type:complete